MEIVWETFLRSLLFYTLIIPFLFFSLIFSQFLTEQFLVNYVKFTACSLISLAKFILRIDYKISGVVPKQTSIICMQHQSFWEVLFPFTFIDRPIFFCKKELFWVPLFGRVLKRLQMIRVDRNGGNGDWLAKAKQALDRGRSVIIFPEGTRSDYGKVSRIRSGVLRMYNKFKDFPVVIVSLNSGKFWPRRSFLKYSGIINICFFLVEDKHLGELTLKNMIEKHFWEHEKLVD